MSSFRAPELRSPVTANSSLTGMSEISLRRPVGRDSTLAPAVSAAACELSLLAGPEVSGRRRKARGSRSRVTPPGASFVDETLHEEGEDEEWEDAEEPSDERKREKGEEEELEDRGQDVETEATCAEEQMEVHHPGIIQEVDDMGHVDYEGHTRSRDGATGGDESDDLESTLVGEEGAVGRTPTGPDAAGDRRGPLDYSSINLPGVSLARASVTGDPARLSIAPGDPLASSALLNEFSGELDELDEESYYSEEEELGAGAAGPPQPPRTAAGRRPTRQERFAALFPEDADKAGAAAAPNTKAAGRRKLGALPATVRSNVRLFAVADADHKRWLKANATGLKVTADAQREFVSALEQYEQLVLAQLTQVLDGRRRVTTADVLELLRRSGVAPTVADVRRLVRTHLPLEAQRELVRVTEAGGLYPANDPLSEE
ncbi:hypothetical protein FJT64_002131 [Amphibalanus amphitrite]|uniref:Uncharacterized protein n=1 Tax=Amphibalanus amphitrite TaxID=1232801 RepID=A0A6A4X2T7_AMPAM|nr:hypothetical protein FJT64_002131 [Amphibalanus amphitrite]